MLLYSLLRFNLTAISKYKPPRACIWRGDLTEGFLCYEFGGAYFRNFTVRPWACCAILSNFLVVNYYPQYLLGLHALFLTTFLEIAVYLQGCQRQRISPGYYECGPRLLFLENRRKIEAKEIPSCFIPCLLVVFTWQLEI